MIQFPLHLWALSYFIPYNLVRLGLLSVFRDPLCKMLRNTIIYTIYHPLLPPPSDHNKVIVHRLQSGSNREQSPDYFNFSQNTSI